MKQGTPATRSTAKGSTVALPSKTTRTSRTAIDEMMAADAADGPPPNMIERLNHHAKELEQYYKKLALVALEAEDLTKKIQSLENETLPSLMDEASTKHIELIGGITFTRGEEVYASISKANAPKATQWLIDHGYGALVKLGFNIEVAKGDVKLQEKIRKILVKAKLRFGELTNVHPQTLKAFVKESLEAGRKLPKEISVHTQPRVKVEIPSMKPIKEGK
jgi:hypothetical protein